ncbi:MAG: N-acetylmuramoyl-L-alanine amidase [Leptospirales bacterium]
MKIVNHKLDVAKYQASPNKSGKFAQGNLDTLIIHFTAASSASVAVNWLRNPKARASAHVIVDEKGAITQLVDFDTVAWHAGVSSYDGRTGFNKYSIGIEISNPGKLEKVGEKYKAWFGTKYSADEALLARHRNSLKESYWHTYTEKQIATVQELCATLIETYNIKHILGHEEIAKGRKWDPGPAFPLDKMREYVLTEDRSLEGSDANLPLPELALVNTKSLNIRSGPSGQNQTVAPPLARGTKVEVLGQANNWYKVRTSVEGWVSKNYLIDI